MTILGVDVGGTFTDAVVLDAGRVTTAKVLTAPRQEEAVVAAARAAGAADVERFAHGTTVATNALLERKGARTAFVTTAGFEHLLHLRRQTRAHLYRPCAGWPEPLVPLERCHGVRGRLGREGELEPVELDSLPEVMPTQSLSVFCTRIATQPTNASCSLNCGGGCRTHTSSPRTRWLRSSGSTNGHRRPSQMLTSARSSPAISVPLARPVRARGYRSRW